MKKILLLTMLFLILSCKEKQINSLKINYQIIPETFELYINRGKSKIPVSISKENYGIASNFTTNNNKISFEYLDKNIFVSIGQVSNYLEVSIVSSNDSSFVFPSIQSSNYYLPLGEGKSIPANDKYWKEYFKNNNEFYVLEALSMPFTASVYDNYAVLCIMENPYNSKIIFDAKNDISFSIKHDYTYIDKVKTNTFRIYLLENNINKIAKTYRNYIIEKGNFVKLADKLKNNSNIKKLYGAPHIYLFQENIISKNDIDWTNFKSNINSETMNYIKSFLDKDINTIENKDEIKKVFNEIEKLDYISEYHKNIICNYLTKILIRDDFYNENMFAEKIDNYDSLTIANKIQTNKFLVSSSLNDVFNDYTLWLNDETVDLLDSIYNSNITNAWIGLNSWEQAYIKPELVKKANDLGFLIASYDSYHSIHEPNNEKWITAKFEDDSLYDNATIEDENGIKILGFNNIGRHLNPTLSIPAVQIRMSNIMNNNLNFNSWFIDCDATGEVFNDYSSNHITTREEDLKARLERISYIRDKYNLVVGSEGGNDFANSTIAFAHGIELPSFSWIDDDMSKNANSQYYIGRWYSQNGGVPEHFSKRVNIKDKYYKIYIDPAYDIPLYKLVYNDSVITSYHWDWSTFKIKDAVIDRMLREILYNVPSIYNLDSEEWNKYKNDISNHNKVWSDFSRKAILKEMTNFEYLTEDKKVQKTIYGDNIIVVSNFSDDDFEYENKNIIPHSLLIIENDDYFIYTPKIDNN